MPDWKLCETCAEECFAPEICMLNVLWSCVQVALGTLHVRFLHALCVPHRKFTPLYVPLYVYYLVEVLYIIEINK